MHIWIFFDDVIKSPYKTRRAIFSRKVFFDFRPYFDFFGGGIDFSAFLYPKLGPMNGKLIREIPGIGLADR